MSIETSKPGTDVDRHPVPDPGLEEHVERYTDVDQAAGDRAYRQVVMMLAAVPVLCIAFVVIYFAVPRDSFIDLFGMQWNALNSLLGLTGELSAGGASGRGTLGAEILVARGQLHPEVVRYADLQGKNPVHEALLGGEDYALLGTCAPDMLPPLHAAIPGLTSIGVVTAGGGLVCNNEPLDNLAAMRGFDHFDRNRQGD